jgi:hypothetical protein
MAKDQYLPYTIHLTDEARVSELVAQYPNGVIRAPFNPNVNNTGEPGGAAVEWTEGGLAYLPIREVGDAPIATAHLSSEYFTPENDFPRDVATFRKSSGWWIFGSDTKFYWLAKFAYLPAPAPDTSVPAEDAETEPAPIPRRRWFNGFELSSEGEPAENEGGFPTEFNMAASRVAGGRGTRNCGVNGRTAHHIHDVGELGTWDRFYMRVHRYPSESDGFYAAEGGNQMGFQLHMTTTGQVTIHSRSTVSTPALLAVTSAILALDVWYRIDVLVAMGPVEPFGSSAGVLWLHVNGVKVGEAYGSGTGVDHDRSILGVVGNEATYEIDFDDWISSDIPLDKPLRPGPGVTIGAATWRDDTGDYAAGDYVLEETAGIVYRARVAHTPSVSNKPPHAATWNRVTESVDWLMGSHVVVARPNGYAAEHQAAAWHHNFPAAADPVDWRVLLQHPLETNFNESFESETVSARLAVTTDVQAAVNIPGAVGVTGVVVVGFVAHVSGAMSDGQRVGFRLNGGDLVELGDDTKGHPGSTITWFARGQMFGDLAIANTAEGTALGQPVALAPLTLDVHYVKAATTSDANVRVLVATLEVLGIFGPEDLPPGSEAEAPPRPRGIHNGHYPHTPWARQSTPPLGAVVVKAGSYVGNGTGQDLLFDYPVHWLWIRGGTGDSVRWWASCTAPHRGNAQGVGDTFVTAFEQDLTFEQTDLNLEGRMRFRVRVAGSDPLVNANGTTYGYLAFSDPAARFLLCGAGTHRNAFDGVDALPDPAFLAEFAFLFNETSSGSTVDKLYTKGLGHADDDISLSSNGTPVSGMAMAPGQLTFPTTILSSQDATMAYALWRRADGNNHPDQGRVMATGTYVGDGGASRTIGYAPVTGRRPLWAWVQPHNASVAYYRDPYHTGTTSSTTSGSR